MKKIIHIFITFFAIFSSISVFFAQETFANGTNCVEQVQNASKTSGTISISNMISECSKQSNGISPDGGSKNVSGIKEKVTEMSKWALGFAALFAVGAIVFAGIQYTTAYGNTERLEKAKKTGIFAAIGLMVALLSYSIVDAVVKIIFSVQ